ncbi:MAG TPA: hypothetical protein PLM18_06195, partial [Sedimentibacter sp.]|nr:hypothetical protein [Sedimentibacter sp.]
IIINIKILSSIKIIPLKNPLANISSKNCLKGMELYGFKCYNYCRLMLIKYQILGGNENGKKNTVTAFNLYHGVFLYSLC